MGLNFLAWAEVWARPTRDRHKLQRKLEQAELRKRREQEALVGLQKKAALLSQCLGLIGNNRGINT